MNPNDISKKSTENTLAENLEKYRKECGFTQQELANMLNINRTTYTKYETGVTVPGIGLVAKIAALFNVDINALLGYENTAPAVSDSDLFLFSVDDEEREIFSIVRLMSQDERHNLLESLKNKKEENN